VTQDFQLRYHEGTLAEVDGEAVVCQDGEELVQVVQVFRRRFAAQPAVI
jgi:hypothetical protein